MQYKRIFVFGCSWTNYQWPTWADIIRYSTDIPVENWGASGIGNVGIMHRMIECDLVNHFNEDDLIIVQWTSWTREDRVIQGDNWLTTGNVFNNRHYDKKFIEKYWSWDNDVVKNAGAIIAANKMFNISYQFNMLPYKEKETSDELRTARLGKLARLFESNIPDIDVFPNEQNTFFNGNSTDAHPDIKTHLYFFNNYIRDRFNLNLGDKEQVLLDLQEEIANRLDRRIHPRLVGQSIKHIINRFDRDFYKEKE